MRRVPVWRRYLRFWRADVAADVEDELRFHFEERVTALVALGRSPDEARAEAVAEFGDVGSVRDALRTIDARMVQQRRRAFWWDAARQDLRYAVRSLGRARGLAATIVLTLALGIGLDAAMFSFLSAVFLRPPTGIAQPDALRRVWAHHFITGNDVPFAALSFSYPDYLEMSRALTGSARLAVYESDHVTLGRGDGAPTVHVDYASANLLPLLGARTSPGRTFAPDEDRMGAGAPVAVLSHALWERRFDSDPAVIGRSILLDRQRYTVIGVARPDFSGIDLDATDVWVPLASMPAQPIGRLPWYETRNYMGLSVVARLSSGTDPRAVEARLTALLRRPTTEGPPADTLERAELGSIIRARGPGKPEQQVAIAVRLGGVALIVLLIACANVSNLLLARAVQRRREIAVRLALGMSRVRLGALLLTETSLLAIAAAVAASLAALWGGSLLRGVLMPDTHWAAPVFDWRVGAFTAVVALAAGIATGFAPIAQSGREDLTVALKAGAREGGGQRSRLRTALLVVQGALSIVLLAGAGAFVRSLHNIEQLDLGFDVDHLVFAQVSFDDVPGAQRRSMLEGTMPLVAQRLAAAPSVERVAMASMAPMRGFSATRILLPGRDTLVFAQMGPVFTAVSPDYFAATGMRVLRGRGIRSGAAEVVVNEELARTLWPGKSALGQCMQFRERTNPCYTVVGVVENAHHWEVTEAPWPEYYLPLDHMPVPGWAPQVLVIRTAPAHAGVVAAEARRLLQEEFPGAQPNVQAMAEVLAPVYRPWRLGAILFTVFGLLALCVAAVGVYSTLSYTVGQRGHEIGIRMALGARAGDVVRMVLHEALRIVAVGIAIGLALALLLGRLIAALLYGTTAHDPLTLAATASVLLGVAIVAALLPARRAARVDPMVALRADG